MSAFRGAMKIKIAPYDSATVFKDRSFIDVSQSSQMELSATEEKETIPDTRDGSGGTWATFTRIGDITCALGLRDFTNENFAMGLWGTMAPLSATAIVDEPHVAKAGKFIPADRIIDLTVPVVLKKGAETIDAADYEVSFGGVTFAATFTTSGLVDDDDILMSYTPQASVDIEALVNTSPEVSILGEGINAFDGKVYVLRIWKAKLGIAQNVGFITDSFGTLPITVNVQKDETVPGAATSKFFKLERAN